MRKNHRKPNLFIIQYNTTNFVRDRNNLAGYVLENCIPCCDICNYMKNNLPKDEFFHKVNKIYKKHLMSGIF